jgi:hypothetical protein
MDNHLAPILVFAFNRPDHLTRTLDALAACPESKKSILRIYCDGPRNPEDDPAVAKVVEIAKLESRFLSSEIITNKKNRGLALSIICGVTDTINQFGRAIILEDDIVVSSYFLAFMNAGLEKYAGCPEVASVCGYMYPIDHADLPPTFFLRGTDCWGWATWKRAWNFFESDGEILLKKLIHKRMTWEFDLDGSYPYTKMLRDQIAGRNNSWAIRWHASIYLRNMVSCFPRTSLVLNIGLDGSGTHCQVTDKLAPFPLDVSDPLSLSDLQSENLTARNRIARFLLSLRSLRYRLWRAWNKLILNRGKQL